MEPQANYGQFDHRRPMGYNHTAPSVRWVKEWLFLLKYDSFYPDFQLAYLISSKHSLKALRKKENEMEAAEPEPTTEILFLCSFEGCGKTFFDVRALRKHAHIHGERAIHFSKLKRHFLIHTGERAYKCPHGGCGKSHMKTHSQDNYYLCPFLECEKRSSQSCPSTSSLQLLRSHPSLLNATATPSDRPYGGCDEAYTHEYKLNLHLRNQHPTHFSDEKIDNNAPQDEADEQSGQNVHNSKRGSSKRQKLSKSQPTKSDAKTSSSKSAKRKASMPAAAAIVKKPWPVKEEPSMEEDSEETEEDRDNTEAGWKYQNNMNMDDEDDEETEDEN
uniref:C2H2-type domain-containing protein n=1 Tax=Kalanchoe fedtschenkoi TaxID=63787 RepID=A0A7N0RFW3_KALFE